MEPDKAAASSLCTDGHSLPEELHEINTEFCDESITYSEVRVHGSSNIQEKKKKKKKKKNACVSLWAESLWCLAAVAFALLYLIALVVAAMMTAKVFCLEEILNTEESKHQNITAHCKII
ncbi:uncharacterized protein LOC141575893 isoform X1 [Camelus bactrianus]|uniref:Uncharacterized protein LOC141575893 isoform X1 n=1 Tax=Camelus bactrianus TaxID=9837 RepID=A0AC58PTV7_CAMBA